jgi:hypothetical protein
MPTYPSDRTSSAMLNLQKEVLNVYEQANRAWFARVKSEVNLWSALARKLSATRYTPEALDSYQKFMVERVQMAAEDGRQLLHDCQESRKSSLAHYPVDGRPQVTGALWSRGPIPSSVNKVAGEARFIARPRTPDDFLNQSFVASQRCRAACGRPYTIWVPLFASGARSLRRNESTDPPR